MRILDNSLKIKFNRTPNIQSSYKQYYITKYQSINNNTARGIDWNNEFQNPLHLLHHYTNHFYYILMNIIKIFCNWNGNDFIKLVSFVTYIFQTMTNITVIFWTYVQKTITKNNDSNYIYRNCVHILFNIVKMLTSNKTSCRCM